MGSGAAVDEANMILSPASEAGPRPPEMISADNPKSSIYASNGEQGYSKQFLARAMCAPDRREISGPSPMGIPNDVPKCGEFAETESLSFCLNKVSSSSEPASIASKPAVHRRNLGRK
jgi:hypothetical protein